MKLLDAVAKQGDVETALNSLRERVIQDYETEGRFNWRYYLVKYAEMREGRPGIYFGRDGDLGIRCACSTVLSETATTVTRICWRSGN